MIKFGGTGRFIGVCLLCASYLIALRHLSLLRKCNNVEFMRARDRDVWHQVVSVAMLH